METPGEGVYRPPQRLTKETQTWVDEISATYDLRSQHLKLLQAAGQAWDEYISARRFTAEHGSTYMDRFRQPCSRPEVQIARDARLAFIRILRELALPGGTAPGDPERETEEGKSLEE